MNNITYNLTTSIAENQLISQYCHGSLTKILILGIIVLLIWLLEPTVRKKVNDSKIERGFFISKTTILFIYKWIGIGLFFMTLYSMFIMERCLV